MKKKKKQRSAKTNEELQQGAHSVNYEVAMLLGTYIYRSDPRDPTMSYMILESFLIHVRNLFEFLCKQEEPHGDEVRSTHYVEENENNESWRAKQEKFERRLQKEMDRIHKRLARISYDRDSLDRTWVKADLVRELRDMMRSFTDHLPNDKKEWFKIDELLSLEIPENGPQVVDSTSDFQGTIIYTDSDLRKNNSNRHGRR